MVESTDATRFGGKRLVVFLGIAVLLTPLTALLFFMSALGHDRQSWQPLFVIVDLSQIVLSLTALRGGTARWRAHRKARYFVLALAGAILLLLAAGVLVLAVQTWMDPPGRLYV